MLAAAKLNPAPKTAIEKGEEIAGKIMKSNNKFYNMSWQDYLSLSEWLATNYRIMDFKDTHPTFFGKDLIIK